MKLTTRTISKNYPITLLLFCIVVRPAKTHIYTLYTRTPNQGPPSYVGVMYCNFPFRYTLEEIARATPGQIDQHPSDRKVEDAESEQEETTEEGTLPRSLLQYKRGKITIRRNTPCCTCFNHGGSGLQWRDDDIKASQKTATTRTRTCPDVQFASSSVPILPLYIPW